ncbi:MAG TPA: cobalamin-binding protein [Casimicrobiaceae bacterium]|nr:cobalamin-binding protein [Casimicrobiaceae bacterium]
MAGAHRQRQHRGIIRALVLFFCLAVVEARGAVRVTDDRGSSLELEAPAKRIVSLAPNITELLFAAGAGGRVVGASEFSDYPAAAKAIPRIGSSSHLDLERIVQLKPDLVVVWGNGTPELQLEALRRLGIPLFYTEPRRLEDLPRTMLRLGALAGSEPRAREAAAAFSARLSELRSRYADRAPVRLFWQVWAHPLLTISGRHIINDAIRLCGGVNIFADLPALVPSVSIEAVIAADPEAIVTTDASADGGDGLDQWRKLRWLSATKHGNFIVLDADTIDRASPRIIDGAAALCGGLESVRAKRNR